MRGNVGWAYSYTLDTAIILASGNARRPEITCVFGNLDWYINNGMHIILTWKILSVYSPFSLYLDELLPSASMWRPNSASSGSKNQTCRFLAWPCIVINKITERQEPPHYVTSLAVVYHIITALIFPLVHMWRIELQ